MTGPIAGADADDSWFALGQIADKDARIEQLSFRWISRPPAPSGIAPNSDLSRFEPEALELRSKYNVPFWMAMGFVLTKSGESLPPSMIEATAFHAATDPTATFIVNLKQERLDRVRDEARHHRHDRMLTVLSDVAASGQVLHIPMLDFRATPSAVQDENIARIVRGLGHSGFLLDSGNSYHFYGDKLIGQDELREFLARASLFIPIVDQRWTAHQLIEGRCALRVSPTQSTGNFPRLVKTIS